MYLGIRIYDRITDAAAAAAVQANESTYVLGAYTYYYTGISIIFYIIYNSNNNNVRRVLSLGVPRLNIKRTARDSGH